MRLLQLTARYWQIISGLLLVLITVLSLTPLPALPEFPGSDKTHHFLAYASLMFPVALSRPKHWLFIALFFIAWSGGIELIQPFVNRYAEWGDLVANSIGVVIGILVANTIKLFTKL